MKLVPATPNAKILQYELDSDVPLNRFDAVVIRIVENLPNSATSENSTVVFSIVSSQIPVDAPKWLRSNIEVTFTSGSIPWPQFAAGDTWQLLFDKEWAFCECLHLQEKRATEKVAGRKPDGTRTDPQPK